MPSTSVETNSEPVAIDDATGRSNRERGDVRDGVRVARGSVATRRAARPEIQRHSGRLRACAADRKWFGRAARVLRVRRVQGGREKLHAVRKSVRRTRGRRVRLDDREVDGVGD